MGVTMPMGTMAALEEIRTSLGRILTYDRVWVAPLAVHNHEILDICPYTGQVLVHGMSAKIALRAIENLDTIIGETH